jgi:hypothetical protein
MEGAKIKIFCGLKIVVRDSEKKAKKLKTHSRIMMWNLKTVL